MKTTTIFLLSIFFTALGYSQNPINAKDILFTSDHVTMLSKQSDPLSKFSVALNRFTDGQIGIEFSFISQTSPIRPDSIILTSSTNEMLTLNYRWRDTIYFLSDGSLKVTSSYYLGKNEFEIFKEDLITTIILIADKKQLVINLRKKSQLMFKDLINKF